MARWPLGSFSSSLRPFPQADFHKFTSTSFISSFLCLHLPQLGRTPEGVSSKGFGGEHDSTGLRAKHKLNTPLSRCASPRNTRSTCGASETTPANSETGSRQAPRFQLIAIKSESAANFPAKCGEKCGDLRGDARRRGLYGPHDDGGAMDAQVVRRLPSKSSSEVQLRLPVEGLCRYASW
jgi:hypothetical protein